MNHQSKIVDRQSHRAFTLIELLVVIAIIAILAAILFPVFSQAKAAAKQSVCLSNEKQLGTAVQLYLNDNDDQFPGTLPAIQQPPDIVGDITLMSFDLQLMPYVRNTAIFLCPGDGGARLSPPDLNPFWDLSYKKKALPRSYHYVGGINTVEAGGYDHNTGMGDVSVSADRAEGVPASRIERTSETITHIEAWGGKSMSGVYSSYVGQAWDSTFCNCDVWKLAGRKPNGTAPSDRLPPGCAGYNSYDPSPGHRGALNYLMADTSAKYRTWGQVRGNDFAMFKLQKSTKTFVP